MFASVACVRLLLSLIMIYVVFKGVLHLHISVSLVKFLCPFSKNWSWPSILRFYSLSELPSITAVARKPSDYVTTRRSASGRLTFAGVGGRVRSPRVPVEARLAPLALAPFGVVQTVAHASAALAGLAPRRPIKMAALGVAVALALWCGKREISTSGTGGPPPGPFVRVRARK